MSRSQEINGEKDEQIWEEIFHQALDSYQKYEASQELLHLENAISMQRCAVELVPESHQDLPWRLSDLRCLLSDRFDRLGELDDLDSAISTQRRANTLTPHNHPDLPPRINDLGSLLYERFNRLGELDDIDSAISMLRRAIELTPEDNPNMPAQLTNLGIFLSNRFERLGELNDLEGTISELRRAVDLTPEGHSDMPGRLGSLGKCLEDRFDRLGELDDLESALSVQRRAVELTPDDHPDLPKWLGNLGTHLSSRFKRLGKLSDLESAISTQRRAIELTSKGDLAMPRQLDILATSLSDRFDSLGELDDLESAIAAQRLAVELTPEDHHDMPSWLDNLGNYLGDRFDCLGELDDLESAIWALRRAVELTPDEHPEMSRHLNNLGIHLSIRFKRLGELSDLESALSTQRRALELMPEGHPQMPSRLHNMASRLSSRFERLGEFENLESAISVQRRAIELTPKGHPRMSLRLNNLANFLQSRFERAGELNDLENAISIHRHAVELTPEGHPDMSLWLSDLGKTLDTHFRLHQDQRRFEALVETYQTASFQSAGLPSQRILCANTWARLETNFPEFGSPASRLGAHSCIMGVLPEVVWLGHSISRRYQESSQVANYVGDAVSVAINLGELQQAVEWLDAGRGLIWSQVLSLRAPADELAEGHPALANKLKALSVQLQHAHLVQLPKITATVDSVFSNDTNHHRRIVVKYEKLIKEIRAIPGFEQFLRPRIHTDLALVTARLDGPVVFINVSLSRCDALVLFPGGALRLIPLPDLNRSRAEQLSSRCKRLLDTSNVRQRALIRQGAVNAAHDAVKLLGNLWKLIASPILEALGFMDRHEHLPHITWCPTGPLTQLPLHAAGLYPEFGQTGLHVYDFVVSSYTPSLSALVRAQSGAAQSSPSPSALIVTQPATPNLSPLSGVVAEGAQLRQILSESQIASRAFNGDEATVESIEAAIARFPWVHLACHGVQDAGDPTQSAFMLHDGGLTLSTLMKTVADDAELAFLSACQTATGDEKAPEEAAHLTAGMLAVGFKGVVGTMWSIGDADAPVVVEAYYRKLLELRRTGAVAEGSTGAAYALHEAVKALRERVGEASFLRWVPFVHYGV